MQKFMYKAWDNNFNILKGLIEEDDREAAEEKLRLKGLKIIYVNKKLSLSDIKLGRKTLKEEEIATFCGQMGIIINSGVSIITGLEVIKQQNKKLSRIADVVLTGIKKGETLGSSMEKAEVFPKLLTDMVKSGELSGNVDEIMFNMENYYQREAAIRSKVKNASVYPLVLLAAAVGMLMFFNFFVFPQMKDLFKDNNSLPGITKVLLNSMNYLNHHFILVAAVVAVIVILIGSILKLPKVKYYTDTMALRIPVIGEVKNYIITSRFTTSMAIFLKSAVPLINSMESIQLIIGNLFLSEKIKIAKSEIINGSSIADSLDEQKIFDPLVIQMIRIGEETGKLEDMLFKLSEIYDKKVETGITRAMSLVEPVFTLIIGLLVGVVVVAMALPILSMSSNMQ